MVTSNEGRDTPQSPGPRIRAREQVIFFMGSEMLIRAPGDRGRSGRPDPRALGWAFAVLPVAQVNPTLSRLVEFIAELNRLTIFWTALAILLTAGCVVFLSRWLYERRVLRYQEKLGVLCDILDDLGTSSDASRIQQQLAEAVPSLVDATHCFLLVLNPATQQLEYRAGSDRIPTSAVSLSAISGAVTCFRNQSLTEVPDAEDCPFVDYETVRRFAQKSLLYVPLMVDGSCLGVIEVEDRDRKRTFSVEQKAMIEQVSTVACLGLEIARQRSIKDQVHRAEKLAAVRELVHEIGNELRAPLERIKREADEGKRGETAPALAVRLKNLEKEARKALEAVKRLVNFAGPRTGARQNVDIHVLLQRLADSRQQWSQARHFEMRLALLKVAPDVSADPDHLEQLLLNILKYSVGLLAPFNGELLQVSTNLLQEHILISIRCDDPPATSRPDPDEPVGEPPAPGGDGLPLSVCRTLVEGVGGNLRVERASGGGFRIDLEYPLTAAALSARQTHLPESPPSKSRSRASTTLVIDDDQASQSALLHHVAESGYRVIPVSTAEEAMDLCERMWFEWVFCAARIGRFSGLEIYERVHRQAGNFVLVEDATASVDSGEVMSAQRYAVLRKPFTAQDVSRIMSLEGPANASSKGEDANA